MSVYKVQIQFNHTMTLEASSEEEAIKWAKASIEASGYFVAKNSSFSIEGEYPHEVICGDHLLLLRDCGCEL